MHFPGRQLFPSVFVILLALCGCSDVAYKAEISSDTSWSAEFADQTIEGSGNKTIDLPDSHPSCCVVQKQTENGWLAIYISAEGGGFLGIFGGPSDSDQKETLESYGILKGCSEE